jgi:hypothetical protein
LTEFFLPGQCVGKTTPIQDVFEAMPINLKTANEINHEIHEAHEKRLEPIISFVSLGCFGQKKGHPLARAANREKGGGKPDGGQIELTSNARRQKTGASP